MALRAVPLPPPLLRVHTVFSKTLLFTAPLASEPYVEVAFLVFVHSFVCLMNFFLCRILILNIYISYHLTSLWSVTLVEFLKPQTIIIWFACLFLQQHSPVTEILAFHT